jgi:hypothetical protein
LKISVNGTVVCQDNTVFAYNNLGGNCTGAGISSSFVNCQSGDYEVVFSTAPANNAVITASWTNLMTPDPQNTALARPTELDWFGDGKFGATSAIGTPGYTQYISWLYDTKMPNVIPGLLANTPFIREIIGVPRV